MLLNLPFPMDRMGCFRWFFSVGCFRHWPPGSGLESNLQTAFALLECMAASRQWWYLGYLSFGWFLFSNAVAPQRFLKKLSPLRSGMGRCLQFDEHAYLFNWVGEKPPTSFSLKGWECTSLHAPWTRNIWAPHENTPVFPNVAGWESTIWRCISY